ncbi:hypothetical protein BAE36_04290 [Rhizobium leguminosarum bv. trifolii]|uniref:Uncharacterized protein n=1 Tax=Rhizobium leguminosarum bv. trifolii TaxID=386 RepID=A0A1B8RHP5_RHILT|nr:hypothetical protein [Rhizobium leguminosarum bv. trifolii]OBY08335.1 hypothetical protein BAE36_04290 [Rhizobium leguminosarum bv. trifolii]
MKLKLSPIGGFDDVVVIDGENRIEIPYKQIDFETLEVDDAYGNTASVVYVDYPPTFTEEKRRAYRHYVIRGP